MKRYIYFVIVLFCFNISIINAISRKETPKSVYEIYDSIYSAAILNTPLINNERDRISINKDGHLQRNNQRVRIFGTNITTIPKKDMAAYNAQLLSGQGINCIRFHHMDTDGNKCLITRDKTGKHVLDNERLDDFDYFFSELKKQGIYSNFNFLTDRTLSPADGFKQEITSISKKATHVLGFWNKQAIDYQKNYITEFMNHINPYTGLAYKDDSALAIVEINNENGLMMAYYSGWMDTITGEYWHELEDRWNEWLKSNNLQYQLLSTEFNKIENSTSKVLVNEESSWILELHEGADANIKNNSNQHIININNKGTSRWHIQYFSPQLNMSKEKTYTLTFRAKASKNINCSVLISQNHHPWKISDFKNQIYLTQQWQTFSFSFSHNMTDDNLRLLFGDMGLYNNISIYIDNISLIEEDNILYVKEGYKSTSENKTVRFPSYNEFKYLPDVYKNLILRFMWDLEFDYWNTMQNFIKNEINTKCLTMGTIMGCSTPELLSCFDIIDSHLYWNHPQFPNSDWSTTDYYVQNQPLIKAKSNNTLTSLAKRRIYGKPFSVSEYDHPYPNQYTAEMYPMISSYGCFQDWDCIFTFFTSIISQENQTIRIRHFFDQINNPSKAFASPLAARVFRNFMVNPGKENYYIPINIQDEKDNLYKSSCWNIGNPSGTTDLAKEGFIHKIGIVLEENPPTDISSYIKISNNNSNTFAYNPVFSDNNEIYFDTTSGVYIVCNNNVTISVIDKNGILPQMPIDWEKGNQLLPLSNNRYFASVMAIKENDNYIIYNCGWSGNKKEFLHEYGKNYDFPVCRKNIRLTANISTQNGPSVYLSATGKMKSKNGIEIVFNADDNTILRIIPIQ